MLSRQSETPVNAFEKSSTEAMRDGEKLKILVADDDQDSRLMLKTLLEYWNYSVIEAQDGIDAIGKAEKNLPDLIFIDIRMPYLDGFKVTSHLRQSAETVKTPVIFLSGCAETLYRQKAAAVGGDDFLVKPLNFEKLRNVLQKHLTVR